jgi:Ulp1 protease family, C-terminal catalytic domain
MKNSQLRLNYLLATTLSFLSHNIICAAYLEEGFPGYVSEESTTSSIEISSAPSVSVNERYCYTVFDINSFLRHRFKSTHWVSVVSGIPHMSDIDAFTEIRRQLEEEKTKSGATTRFILMPYVDQRLGMFAVSIIGNGEGVSGVVIPSISSFEIPADLITLMHSVYGDTFSSRVLQGYYLLENRPEDHGVVTLENLCVFGSNGGISGFPIVSTLAFRHRHIEESTYPIMGTPLFLTEGFYEFPERQARNLPVIPYLLPNSRLCWAQVRSFELTVSHKDREKIKRVIDKLSSISKKCNALPRTAGDVFDLTVEKHRCAYERFVRGAFLNLFGDIDGSNVDPIDFGLQLRYKQIPWHLLLSLHWWQSSSERSTGLIDMIIGELARASSSGMTGFGSLERMLLKIVRLETLTADDLYGINLLKPFWEYAYVKAVLEDLTNRIICIVDAEEEDTWTRRLGVIRLLQISGEYINKLKHIPAFKVLLKNLDLDGFRNILSHLENLQHTIQFILEDHTLNWGKIYNEVCSLGIILRDIEARCVLEEGTVTAQWGHIKTLSDKLPSEIISQSFANIKELRKALSKANPSLKKEKSSMSETEAKAFGLKLSHDATQRDAIQKVLSDKKIDKSDSRRLHEYVEFIRTIHDQSIAFDREGFWEDKTTYPELLFHQMRGSLIGSSSIDTPSSKRIYRLELLDSAINLLEWVRRLLGVEDIDLILELALSDGLTERAKKEFPETIINTAVHFNMTPTLATNLQLQQFLEDNPSGLLVLEFLIGAAYEALRSIFYFPEFARHYLQNMHVRNYYAHPDPTYLTPFIVWEAQELSEWDGRSIYTRPDRDNGFQKVLLQEASRLLVPLHHVLLAIRDQMIADLTTDLTISEAARDDLRIRRYEYSPTDIARLLSRLGEGIPGTEPYQRFSLEDTTVVETRIHRCGNRYVLPPITAHAQKDPYTQLIEYLEQFYENAIVTAAPPAELIVPFNPGGHWITLRIQVPEGGPITIEYIDSLHHEEKVINEAKETHIQERSKVLIDAIKARFPDREISDIAIIAPRRQPDSVSCGCVMVENIHQLFRGEALPDDDIILDGPAILDLRRAHRAYLQSQSLDFDF